MKSSLLWKLHRTKNATHPTRLEKDENNKEEISKGPTDYWQWRRSFILGDSHWIFFQVGYPVATSHFAATPQNDVVVCICAHDFQRHGNAFGTTKKKRKKEKKREKKKKRGSLFSCIYNLQITISPTSLFSANFNGNRVKNHPKPWTCPLMDYSWQTRLHQR